MKARMVGIGLLVLAMMSASMSANAEGRKSGLKKGRHGCFRKEMKIQKTESMKKKSSKKEARFLQLDKAGKTKKWSR